MIKSSKKKSKLTLEDISQGQLGFEQKNQTKFIQKPQCNDDGLMLQVSSLATSTSQTQANYKIKDLDKNCGLQQTSQKLNTSLIDQQQNQNQLQPQMPDGLQIQDNNQDAIQVQQLKMNYDQKNDLYLNTQQNMTNNLVNNQDMIPKSADGQKYPIAIQCQFCQEKVTTKIHTQFGVGTWIACFITWITTGCCCLIPFCLEECNDKVHSCPNCKSNLGIKEFKIFDC